MNFSSFHAVSLIFSKREQRQISHSFNLMIKSSALTILYRFRSFQQIILKIRSQWLDRNKIYK